MLIWKKDVMAELKKKGYSTYRIQKEKIISSQTLNNITNGRMIGIHGIDKICSILQCQPGSLIQWVEDEPTCDDK